MSRHSLPSRKPSSFAFAGISSALTRLAQARGRATILMSARPSRKRSPSRWQRKFNSTPLLHSNLERTRTPTCRLRTNSSLLRTQTRALVRQFELTSLYSIICVELDAFRQQGLASGSLRNRGPCKDSQDALGPEPRTFSRWNARTRRHNVADVFAIEGREQITEGKRLACRPRARKALSNAQTRSDFGDRSTITHFFSNREGEAKSE